jgi:phage shock protein PspC (stress-responsive transcriptional regulator)
MSLATHPQADVRDFSLSGARAWFTRKGLTRPRDGRLLAGVATSFARRFDVNVLVARLAAFAAIVILTPLVYVAMWILMPRDAEVAAPPAPSPA